MKSTLLLIAIGLFACSQAPETTTSKQSITSTKTPQKELNSEVQADQSSEAIPTVTKKTSLSQRVFYTENVGWGYQIYDGTTLLLKQVYIPAIQGNHAFDSKGAAEKTANFVLEKIASGIFPPTLSVNELDSLDVLPVNYQR